MSDDEAMRRKREIRRRKILANSEERKRKILGLSKVSTQADENDHHELDEVSKVECDPLLEKTTNGDSDADVLKITTRRGIHSSQNNSNGDGRIYNHNSLLNPLESPPLDPQGMESLRRMLNNSNPNYFQLLNDEQNLPTEPLEDSCTKILLNHSLTPIILAIIVSSIISMGCDWMVSGSAILPFILWQTCKFCYNHNFSQTVNNPSILSAALMLCGIQPHALSKYMSVITFSKQLLDDFAVYLFIIIIWQFVFGFKDFSDLDQEIFEETSSLN